MEEKKEKRVLRIELDDDVKKVSITGKNGDEQVVMSQELDEDDLDKVAPEIQTKPRVQALKAQYAASREEK